MGARLSSDEFAAASASSKPAGEVPDATSGTPGVFDDVKSLGNSLRGLAHDHVRIITLEARQAGESLVNMIAASVVLAVLVVSAWLILVAAGVIVLVGNGVGMIFAMILAAALNLAVAFVLYRSIRELSQNLGFPATIRSLSSARDTAQTAVAGKERA